MLLLLCVSMCLCGGVRQGDKYSLMLELHTDMKKLDHVTALKCTVINTVQSNYTVVWMFQ
jgi:hypothetical protein